VGRPGRWHPGPGAGGRALSGVLLGAVQVVGSLATVPLQPDRTVPDTPLAGALLLAGPVTLVLTRRPLVRAVVATAAAAAYLAIGYVIGPVLVTVGLFLVVAVVAGQEVEAWLVGAAGLIGAVTASWLGEHPVPATAVLPWAGWGVAMFAVADMVRARRESAGVWSRTRAQVRLRQACEERIRVARDLHDEVTHRLQLVDARAAVALPLLDVGDREARETAPETARETARETALETAPETAPETALETARETLLAVRALGDEALTWLRSVDDVLAVRGEAVPRPEVFGLDGLTELAEQWAGAGLLVRAAGDPGPLPPAVDQVAHRVVQEALANVARHSCAPHADIALHRDVDQLTIIVSDPGPPIVPCAESGEPDPGCGAWGVGGAAEWDEASTAELDIVTSTGEWDTATEAGPDGLEPAEWEGARPAQGQGGTAVAVDGVTLVESNGETGAGWDGTDVAAECDLAWLEAELPGGRGLIRMRERVGALGGAVSAGPDGAGWCVHVVIPAGPAG
jgi:signal transduction histidine kinase